MGHAKLASLEDWRVWVPPYSPRVPYPWEKQGSFGPGQLVNSAIGTVGSPCARATHQQKETITTGRLSGQQPRLKSCQVPLPSLSEGLEVVSLGPGVLGMKAPLLQGDHVGAQENTARILVQLRRLSALKKPLCWASWLCCLSLRPWHADLLAWLPSAPA